MRGPTILIVEDEAPLVTLLRYNLEREGFAVLDAQDGEEALAVAREQKPDLVLLDWMLPLMSGIEVCRQLRRNPETRAIPVVMLTACATGNVRERASQERLAGFFFKPCPPDVLAAELRRLIAERSVPALRP